MKPVPAVIDGFSQIRIIQKEMEWHWLMDKLSRQQTRSLLSIGLLDGGMEWHTARYFRDHGRHLDITGIDPVYSKVLQRHQAEVQSWGQGFEFLHGSSRDKEITKRLGRYDAVFIDGDHSYAGVKADFELALTVTDRMIAFHDVADSIYHRQHGCFVADLWQEIKANNDRVEEYILAHDWGGVGIVYV
jgi:cephalosporin hydroxylase